MGNPPSISKDDFDRAFSLMTTVFNEVSGQVQFAEAKNGALFASSMALLVGIVTILTSDTGIGSSVRTLLDTTGLGLFGSAVIALFSFVPVMGKGRHKFALGNNGSGANLVFWGEIRKFAPSAYAETVLQTLQIAGRPSRLLVDLAEQIVINSGIAQRKFSMFLAGVWATLISVIVPSAIMIAHAASNGWVID